MPNGNNGSTARAATIGQLLKTTIPVFLDPPPSAESLRDWFDKENVPRFKTNPLAKRGGGPVYYSVSVVEKLLRQRLMLKLTRGVAA
jgi:hypothetical protein